MEKRRVVVTGLGTVNPLGNTVAESWAAAKAGQCGIAPITQFDTAGFKCKLAAEVKGFDPEAVVDKKEARKMARFTLLALAAANEAIQDSGIDCEAEAENITVSTLEVNNEYRRLSQLQDTPEADIRRVLTPETVAAALVAQKVQRFLLDNAVVASVMDADKE